MSTFQEAADRMARDTMTHAIAYFEAGGDVMMLKVMQQRITGALLRIGARKAGLQPATSSAEVADALGLKEKPHD